MFLLACLSHASACAQVATPAAAASHVCTGGPRPVPVLRGLTPAQAKARLKVDGFTVLKVVGRPRDGTPVGLVMESNPKGRVMMCGQHAVVLYVAQALAMRNFRGDTVDEARSHLVAAGWNRQPQLTTCGAPHAGLLADYTSRLAIRSQHPPEGTEWKDVSTVRLDLTPVDDFWREYVGLPVSEARLRMLDDPALAGWTVVTASSTDESHRIGSAAGDRTTCRVELAVESRPPPNVGPVASGPGGPGSPADDPRSPLAPLGAGTAAGLLAARLLWPSRSEPESNVTSTPQEAADDDTGFFVRCDLPVPPEVETR